MLVFFFGRLPFSFAVPAITVCAVGMPVFRQPGGEGGPGRSPRTSIHAQDICWVPAVCRSWAKDPSGKALSSKAEVWLRSIWHSAWGAHTAAGSVQDDGWHQAAYSHLSFLGVLRHVVPWLSYKGSHPLLCVDGCIWGLSRIGHGLSIFSAAPTSSVVSANATGMALLKDFCFAFPWMNFFPVIVALISSALWLFWDHRL